WLLEAVHGRIWARVSDLRDARRRSPRLPHQSTRPLAFHLGRTLRLGAGLTMNMIAMPRRRLVLVGNGMAGVRALEDILSRAPHSFSITVFGAEPHGNYNRIMLSPVLAGEKTFPDIVTHEHAWYEQNGIELIAGEAVTAIDRTNRRVTGAHGTVRPYDVLILATGSNPVII